jgi:hypothetical protein
MHTISFISSGCHGSAAFGASFASLYALVHFTDALAVLSAFGANLGALSTYMPMMRRVQQHEMSGGAADFRTRHHQPEMCWFDMLATRLQTVGHRGPQTGLIALQTFIDAALHVVAHMIHRSLLGLSVLIVQCRISISPTPPCCLRCVAVGRVMWM